MQTDPWRWLQTDRATPWWNMAFDEAMLHYANSFGLPVIRFYTWEGSPGSFGYFQKIRDVESMTSIRPLVRRCSGGGLVDHSQDWTYSVAVPAAHPWWRKTAEDSYRDMHRWCADGLRSLGIEATLAPDPIHAGPGQCFIGAERNDLLIDGRKVAGAAQRRNRHGLLIQGSIQNIDSRSLYPEWIQSMVRSCPGQAEPWTGWQQDKEFTATVKHLHDTRYTSDSWQRRR